MPWRFSDDVEPYAERVVPLLSRDPAAYTIGLSVIETLRSGQAFGEETPLFGWLEEDGEVRGAVSRTPPYDLLLSVVPDTGELIEALRAHGADVPGVNGDVEAVERFSSAWCAGTGLRASTFLQLRLFTLGELRPPDPPPPGGARLATAGDLELAVRWFDAFTDELDLPDRMGEARTGRAIDDERLWLWEEAGEAVALALRTFAAAGVARIICVYTPPEQRGRRFGGAITAAACADALAREADRMVLFTDAENPAPNKVYERIGFSPVADHRVVHFS